MPVPPESRMLHKASTVPCFWGTLLKRLEFLAYQEPLRKFWKGPTSNESFQERTTQGSEDRWNPENLWLEVPHQPDNCCQASLSSGDAIWTATHTSLLPSSPPALTALPQNSAPVLMKKAGCDPKCCSKWDPQSPRCSSSSSLPSCPLCPGSSKQFGGGWRSQAGAGQSL